MILIPAVIGGAILAIVGYIAAGREHDARHRSNGFNRRATDRPRAVAR